MKLSCKKEDLQENIVKVDGAVSVKTTLPVLNNILIEASGNELQLTSTDLELVIKCKMKEVNISEEGSITIPARKFIDIVKELPPEKDININVDEKNQITIKCSKINFRIMGLPKSEFPPVLEPKKDSLNFKIKQSVLRNMIKKVIFSVSSDETRKILTGVYMIIEGSEIKMVSTDGHRLAFIKGPITAVDKSAKVIVPTKVLNEISKSLNDSDDIDVSVLENQIIFKRNDLIVTSRLIDGQYPSYEQIINKIFDKKVRVKTEEMYRAVKRVSLVAIDKTSAVKLKALDGSLVVSAQTVDVGDAEEEITADYKGEETSIAFNSRYVLDVLKVLEEEETDIQLRDSASAGLIKPVKDDSYIYIIMPVRI